MAAFTRDPTLTVTGVAESPKLKTIPSARSYGGSTATVSPGIARSTRSASGSSRPTSFTESACFTTAVKLARTSTPPRCGCTRTRARHHRRGQAAGTPGWTARRRWDHVEAVIRPVRRPVQLGDVPRVDLVRAGCGQPGLDSGGVDRLAAALAGLARSAQQPAERGLRAHTGALVQQDGAAGTSWPAPPRQPGRPPGYRSAAP
jgi:hypothetical protein